jgi:hypothetical protein
VQRVYAVHKLVVAVDRVNKATSAKDIEQAQILIEALAVRRPAELADSWRAAWNAAMRQCGSARRTLEGPGPFGARPRGAAAIPLP